MRIQETNQILNEARIQRHDHERHSAEQSWGASLTGRIRGYLSSAGKLMRHKHVVTGIASGLGVALAAGVGMAMARPKKNTLLSFLR